MIPLEEHFDSIQGEGFWVGTPSTFIRLWGCPVQCWFCDQGYADGGKSNPRQLMEVDAIARLATLPHVVVTGGEPMIHPLQELVEAIASTGKRVAIETSGARWQDLAQAWITLSPKQHINPSYPVENEFWKRADEIKLVISTGEELAFYKPFLEWVSCPIFLQPEWSDRSNTIPLTLKLLQRHPQFRLSQQTHKYLNIQ